MAVHTDFERMGGVRRFVDSLRWSPSRDRLYFLKIRAEFVHQGVVGQGLGYMTFVLCQAGFDILPVWRCQTYMGCEQVIDEVMCIEAEENGFGWGRVQF